MDSQPSDKEFFDRFMLVLVGLALAGVAVYFIAGYVASGTQHLWQLDDPLVAAKAAERTHPYGRVVVTGEEQPAPAAAPEATAAPEPAPAPVATVAQSGEEIYNSGCQVCHNAGVAGAPKLGDADAWAPRVAQGLDVLREHAVKGYQGSAGVMPAKGGLMHLSDEDVYAAVDYMLESVPQ